MTLHSPSNDHRRRTIRKRWILTCASLAVIAQSLFLFEVFPTSVSLLLALSASLAAAGSVLLAGELFPRLPSRWFRILAAVTMLAFLVISLRSLIFGTAVPRSISKSYKSYELAAPSPRRQATGAPPGAGRPQATGPPPAIASAPTPTIPYGPTWNVWAEAISPRLRFLPLPTLRVHTSYRLIVDFSALPYGSNAFSRPVGIAFKEWLDTDAPDEAEVDVLVLNDGTHFEPQPEGERVRHMALDLAKLKKGQRTGLKTPVSPLEELRTSPDQDFSFGRQSVRIRTTDLPGRGHIALSFWVNGRPLDEITASFCIEDTSPSDCTDSSVTSNYGFHGVDSLRLGSSSSQPDGALTFVQLESTHLFGVFRCNTCSDWKLDEYVSWPLEDSPATLAAYLVNSTLHSFEKAAEKGDDAQFEATGKSLFNLLFPRPGLARDRFIHFIAARYSHNVTGSTAPSLFVRLLPDNDLETFMVPLSLMWVPVKAENDNFLGLHFRVESPLDRQDYTAPSQCLSNWVLLTPPRGTKRPELDRLLERADAGLHLLRGVSRERRLDDPAKFGEWVGTSNDPIADVVLVLGHHDHDMIFFNQDDETPAVLSTAIERIFPRPSLAILAACGTGKPGAADFVRRFNYHGINSVIATSVSVDAGLAGAFVSTLVAIIKNHPNETIGAAHFDAVKALARKDAFRDQALIFNLMGNGNLRLCLPAAAADQ
jgi:hypothetical protein